MNKPFFSIVVTAYNAEKYIKQCIFSVLNQNMGNFEIIIADDCSSDNTLKIIENFDDKRIKILKFAQNTGVSQCRNKALKISKGDYVLFLDADDKIFDNALKTAYEELFAHDVDVLFCPYKVFWKNKNRHVFLNPKYRLKKMQNQKRPFDKKISPKILYSANYEVCTKIYKREFLIKNKIEFKKLDFAEDLPFYYEVLAHAESFSYLKIPFYFYQKGHKEYNYKKVAKGLIGALLLSKKYARGIEDIFYKKSAKMLNFWLLKTDFEPDLHSFAKDFCKKGIIEKNSKFLLLKYKICSKISSVI